MQDPQGRGLPPRIYVPIVLLIAIVFLGTMAYFLRIGFGVTGSPFGVDVNARARTQATRNLGNGTSTEGGGPPPVPRAR